VAKTLGFLCRRGGLSSALLLLFVLAALLSAGLPAAWAGQIELVTRVPPGLSSDSASGGSSVPKLSADGRYMVFLSDAPNLVPGQIDRNGGNDVFLYDRVTGKTVLVSHAAGSEVTAGDLPVTLPATIPGLPPQISPDGRYVAFTSEAGNLVAGQREQDSLNVTPDLFLYDRQTRTTTLVTHKGGSAVTSSNSSLFDFRMTSDGSIAFSSPASDLVEHGTDTNFSLDVFFWDRRSGTTTLISHAASSSRRAAQGISDGAWPSADGRYIAFGSDASDLLPGLPHNIGNVFLYDRVSGKTVLVSHASSSPSKPANRGGGGPVLNAAGTYLVFTSTATDLVPGLQDDTPLYFDIYLYERATGKIVLVSHTSSSLVTTGDGDSKAYNITPDGSWVVFLSRAGNLVAGQTETEGHSIDVFLFERATGKILLASRAAASPVTAANQDCSEFDLSADGRWVVFTTFADNLVAGGADANHAVDVFLFDRLAGTVSRLTPGDAPSGSPAFSADGNWITFASQASNLARGARDLNGSQDVFLYGRPTGRTRLVSRQGIPSVTPSGASVAAGVSADGRFSVFLSSAPNLAPGQLDTNQKADVFLYDHVLRQITLVSRSAASPQVPGNGQAYAARISADGRYVAYTSSATDLVAGQADANAAQADSADLFLFDRVAGTTTLVSHAAGSAITTGDRPSRGVPFLSADGTWVGFTSAATDLVLGQADGDSGDDAFLYNRVSGETALLSHADGSPVRTANRAATLAGLSADGQVALLVSEATDLIASSGPADTNFSPDVFVLDRGAGVTTLVSRRASVPATAAGGERPQLSADGRFVAFFSTGGDLVPGQVNDPAGDPDLYLLDRLSGAVTLVSHAAGSPLTAVGALSSSALSADGHRIAFTSWASNLVPGQIDDTDYPGSEDVFLFDLDSGAIRLVSHLDGSETRTGNSCISSQPSISADGRLVAYLGNCQGLVANVKGSGIYLYDGTTGANALITRSIASPGAAANGVSLMPEISASGNAVLFNSDAWDLVPGDFNGGFRDVFLYTLP